MMNHTPNYQLPAWEKADRIMMADFNDMTQKIDTALGEHSTKLRAVGNCQTYTTTYTGKGSGAAVTLSFPYRPIVVFIVDPTRQDCLFLPYGGTTVLSSKDLMSYGYSWSGNQLTIPAAASSILNVAGTTYSVLALMAR